MQIHEHSQFSALHALEWLHSMGSDECTGNTPANWFDLKDTEFAKPILPVQHKIEIKTAPQHLAVPLLPLSQLSAKATEIAQNCTSLPQVFVAVQQFEGFAQFQKSKEPMYDGNLNSKLMIIAETPFINSNEGALFSKICKSAEIHIADDALIISILPFTPITQRGFSPQDFSLGVLFLKRLITLHNPKLILFLGNAALHSLPNASAGLLKLRGNWQDLTINDENFKSFVTFHPNFLFKQPAQKKLVWQDIRMFKKSIDSCL